MEEQKDKEQGSEFPSEARSFPRSPDSAARADVDSTDAEFSLAQMQHILAQAVATLHAKDERGGALASNWVRRWLSQWSRAEMGDEHFFSRYGARYWSSALAKDVGGALLTEAVGSHTRAMRALCGTHLCSFLYGLFFD